MPNEQPYDVFISYRWVEPDMSWVRKSLFPALEAAGLNVCLDVEDFLPGRDLIQEMTRAGQESRHVLCVITPDYFAENRFVQFEALRARALDPEGRYSALIPLILREVHQVPEWAKLIPVRWTIPSEMPREWGKLLRALGAQRLDPPPHPPPPLGEAAPLVQALADFREIPRPRVRGPSDLPALARYNFDRTAFRYFRALGVGNAMQAHNAKRLVSLYCDAVTHNAALPQRPKVPESLLDAGCGTGLVTMLCREQRNQPRFHWIKRCTTRIGIDYAPHMLQIVHFLNDRINDERCYTCIFEADIRDCNQAVLGENASLRSVDLVLANNVFHWLFEEDAIRLAFRSSYEILDRNGGCLAASIAAEGTGRLFRTAYAEEFSRLLDKDRRDQWQRHLENPIGLQRLDSIVRIARESGFHIGIAVLEYEPIDFESTDAYVEAARGYGEEVFMAPLLSPSPTEREQIWEKIKENLRNRYAAVAGRDVRYHHDQFMIYIIAVRRD